MNPSGPNSTDLPAVHKKVARALQRSEPADDIILRVCETQGWNWEQAEAFVNQVAADIEGRVALPQRVIVLLIGSVTSLGGLLLFVYMALLGYHSFRINLIQPHDPVTFLFFYDYLVNQAPFFLAGMVFGLAVMAGGVYGIGKELGK